MTDTPLLIHVGYHKTATTWLQNSVFRDDHGFSKVMSHAEIFEHVVMPNELDFTPAGQSVSLVDLEDVAAVVLDPPRSGAEAQCRQLAASPVARIAYVSCNPGTFARDAALLVAGGYTLDWVRPVGQFRWSTHVELAARFSR